MDFVDQHEPTMSVQAEFIFRVDKDQAGFLGDRGSPSEQTAGNVLDLVQQVGGNQASVDEVLLIDCLVVGRFLRRWREHRLREDLVLAHSLRQDEVSEVTSTL